MAYNKHCTGVMYAYEASQLVTINATNQYHAVSGVFSAGTENEFTFTAGTTGAITDTADNGGVLRCTDATHGLTTGQYITLNNMGDAAHNGVTRVTVIDVNTFDCDDIAFSSINDTGDWQRGDSLTCPTGCGGHYSGAYNITAAAAAANKNYKVEVYANTTAFDEFAVEALFPNNNYNSIGSGGVGTFQAGMVVWLAIKNTTDAANITIEHANINFHT